MTFALINANAVVSIQILDVNQATALAAHYDHVMDISGVAPPPQIGWTLADGVLSGPPPVQTWLITKLAMLQRLTVPERIGILTYIGANPASVPAILMQNINVATYVDLNRADTRAGVNYLVNFGLITSARATAILNTPPVALEIYQG